MQIQQRNPTPLNGQRQQPALLFWRKNGNFDYYFGGRWTYDVAQIPREAYLALDNAERVHLLQREFYSGKSVVEGTPVLVSRPRTEAYFPSRPTWSEREIQSLFVVPPKPRQPEKPSTQVIDQALKELKVNGSRKRETGLTPAMEVFKRKYPNDWELVQSGQVAWWKAYMFHNFKPRKQQKLISESGLSQCSMEHLVYIYNHDRSAFSRLLETDATLNAVYKYVKTNQHNQKN
jgi:hypothetical protein